VPGPTICCALGDRIRLHFSNDGSHPHTIHFHGIHPFEMDVVPEAGPGMLVVHTVNDGPQAVTVSQVLVNEAYWEFHADPQQKIPRMGRARKPAPGWPRKLMS
jgi:FtsP/CotA-like multicopper oxidase with cupredoxin domain